MRFWTFLFIGVVLTACDFEPPPYLVESARWIPQEYMWIDSPFPESHRLQDHSRAMADKPVRIPEGRRRAQVPEKGAVSSQSRAKALKGPPGLIKILAVRGEGDTEAYVWINGLKAGKAPMFVHLPSGTHRFEVQTPSGEKKREEIEVKPKSNQHLVFRFPELSK